MKSLNRISDPRLRPLVGGVGGCGLSVYHNMMTLNSGLCLLWQAAEASRDNHNRQLLGTSVRHLPAETAIISYH